VQDDQIIETYIPPPHPRGIELSGQWVRLEPLDISRHSKDLFQANTMDRDGSNWAYLPYGPFATLEAYEAWLSEAALTPDPNFFAIIKRADNKAAGLASYLRINPQDGSIEVGHINYSPLLQKTREGTEAMYLMMKWAFESGYRRYEWKCNAEQHQEPLCCPKAWLVLRGGVLANVDQQGTQSQYRLVCGH